MKKLPRINLSKILPVLLLIAGAGMMYPLIQGTQNEITLIQGNIRSLEDRLPALRTQAQQLAAEEMRLKELEGQLKRYTELPDPETTGAASISERLQSRGWKIKGITISSSNAEGELQKTAFRIEFSVGYEGLLEGLRALVAEAAIPQTITLALGKEGQLEGSLVIQIIRVRL